MLNGIWAAMIFISFLCAVCTGRMEGLSQAVLEGAGSAVTLCISTAGMLCVWSGLMKIADSGGLTTLLARLFSPLLRRLFPEYPADSPAMKAISMNVTANLLGLGNAATPFGLTAMREMQAAREEGERDKASRSMILFVVMNTASIQLIPTMIGSYRAKYGSAAPFDILPAVWITSAGALAVGILSVFLFDRLRKKGQQRC